MNRRPRKYCLFIICAISLFIAACPFPILPRHIDSSRENIDSDIASQLETVVSTREEVLLLLGEPDVIGLNESWIGYRSIEAKGGVIFVLFTPGAADGAAVGSEKMMYQNLIVLFDAAGKIAKVNFVSEDCWESSFYFGQEIRSSPCLAFDSSKQHKQSAENNENVVQVKNNNLIPAYLQDFALGKAELVTPGWFTGINEATAAGSNTALEKKLHDQEHWEELARMVLNDRYGDNVRWYFLGRAAEGFGLCNTALHYYEISKKLSDEFVTRCLGLACGGIKLPAALKERFDSVESMLSNGECRSLP